MQIAAKLLNQVSSFKRDQSGNILLVSAFGIFAIMGAAGAAMDYSRISSVKSKMTQALDTAVLATGVELTRGETKEDRLREKFDAFFSVNLQGSGSFATEHKISSFLADPNTGEVTAEAMAILPAGLMGIFGYEEFEVEASSTAIFDQTDVEVAMMLDVTGSMGGQKLRDLKAAAADAIDILLPDQNTKGTRISLVPYAGSVNIGSYYKSKVTNSSGIPIASAGPVLAPGDEHGSENDCVTERGGFYAATDEFYTQARIGDDVRTETSAFECPRRKSSIEPLTNNRSDLKKKIRDLSAGGVTAGHLGIAWSYYTLSENWRDLWDVNNKPAVYSEDTKKIAILMTDGEFNTYYYGTADPVNPREASTAFGGDNVDKSNDLAVALCNDMKSPKDGAPGITIYSVAFQAPASAEATLRACANADTANETFYFSADNGQELRAAFQTIASSIQNLRISQ